MTQGKLLNKIEIIKIINNNTNELYKIYDSNEEFENKSNNFLFDTHSHLDNSFYDKDRNSILSNLNKIGICGVMNIGINIDTSYASINLAKKYSNVFCSVGIHPSEIYDVNNNYIEILEGMMIEPKIKAIGEIGLDYHYEGFNKKKQQDFFCEQIEFAIGRMLPIIVHTRKATDDAISILKSFKFNINPCGVIHCFSGNRKVEETFIEMGFLIGCGKFYKYPKKPNLSKLNSYSWPFQHVLETDAPFVSPIYELQHRLDIYI